MNKVLAEQATVKVRGTWMTLKAILVSKPGGKRVVYVDEQGKEVHSEPLSRSQFKDSVKVKIKRAVWWDYLNQPPEGGNENV